MIKAIILGQLRHMATGAGAALVAWLITQGANPMDAQVLGSAFLAALGCAASIYDKFHPIIVKQPGDGNG